MTDQPLLDQIPSAAGGEPEVVEPYYGNVEEFVVEYLLPNWRHPMGTSLDVCWCPEWWRHAEAISRFEALWWAWEHMRLEGGAAMSAWWRDHADHHMAALTTYGSTFTPCKKAGQHAQLQTWACQISPKGLFNTISSDQ